VTRARAAVALVCVALLAASARGDATGSGFDYLYIRAHEGNASGGHAALRFGAFTFDFQHDAGWLAPRREDSRRFQHQYRSLQNRSIEITRIAAAPETVALLRDTFERRLLAQTRQLEIQGELRADVALLEALAAGNTPHLDVRGAGFFAGAAARPGEAPPVLVALRDRIAERHGDSWLAQRRAAAEGTLRDDSLATAAPAAITIAPLVYPVAADSVSRRLADALAARAAASVLEAPRSLAEGVRAGEALRPDPALALDATMRERLHAARAAIFDAAVALAASRRPDWGEALLLAAARLVAIDESLAADRLVVLDALPRDATVLQVSKRRRTLAPALLVEARRDLEAARARFVASRDFSELEWGTLEEAVSRVAELRAATRGAATFRVASDPLLPEGRATLVLEPRPAATAGELARALASARAAERAYGDALEAEYRYDLVTRNCVSELFRTIEMGLASDDGVAAESERRLGGYVHPVARANFIPFVSSRNVRASWDVDARIHLPSAREYAVAREGTLAAALRESNVWTSRLYAPSDSSTFFVFFTDGSWPLRPLLGAVNLGAALARSGVGVLQLPLDRGRGLRAGLEGALFSLPELFFANIRKGTSEYVPPELRPPPG
jgi:hypothetical protein